MKFNPLYILIIPAFVLVTFLAKYLNKSSVVFYGFAENTELHLNMEEDVMVKRLLVIPGESVKKGELLIETSYPRIAQVIREQEFNVSHIGSQTTEEKEGIRKDLALKKNIKERSADSWDSKILEAQKILDNHKKLLTVVKSFTIDSMALKNSSQFIELEKLKRDRTIDLAALDEEIKLLESSLKKVGKPGAVNQSKLQSSIDYLEEKSKNLVLTAPNDGVVGNILCGTGEHVQAFRTMINFYNHKPTLVNGYIHERLQSKLAKGDSIMVFSSLRSDRHVMGVVIGLGSRIIEIPERLRKITEIKSYGREVSVQIPQENHFLQKEKVTLRLVGQDGEVMDDMMGNLNIF